TPLVLAAAGRHARAVQRLLEAGATVETGVEAGLEVLRFGEAASTPEFRETARWVAELVGVEPQPVPELPGPVIYDLKQHIEQRTEARIAAGEGKILAEMQAQDEVIAGLLEQASEAVARWGYHLVQWKYHPIAPRCLLPAPPAHPHPVLPP